MKKFLIVAAILFVSAFLMANAATVSHTAGQIVAGVFSGNFSFSGTVGIGVESPNATLAVDGIIQTMPRSSAVCDNSTEGGIYYDSDDKHFYGCNGTAWIKLDTTYS